MKRLLKIFLFSVAALLAMGAGFSYLPWLSKVGSSKIGYGTRLVFPGATTSAGADSILVSGLGADNLGNHTATQALNMQTFTINNARQISGADVFTDATDSCGLRSNGEGWLISNAMGRYLVNGNIAQQINHATQAIAFNVDPSNGNAMAMSEQGGSSFFNYASNTEALTLGTAGSGSSVIINSLEAQNWATYTATATLTSLTSFDEVDVSAAGQTFTFPTGATGGALKYVSNIDAVETITVAAPGGETVAGSTLIMPGITGMFQKRGAVWRRLQ